MIKKVSIKNFKSIGLGGVALDLNPLTFLVGPNGGGKSAILEGLASFFVTNDDANSIDLLGYERGDHWPKTHIEAPYCVFS